MKEGSIIKHTYTYTSPSQIEARSMQLIEAELGEHSFSPMQLPIVKRVIHTTADFDYKQNLTFSPLAVERALDALQNGAVFVTDTNMALSGINKPALNKLGCKALCFMADPEVAQKAAREGTTRAVAAMTHAANLKGTLIFAVGNAPTALIRLCELMEAGLRPALVIGVPVGFVNVAESKEDLAEVCAACDVPCIIAHGRKGGSNVAASICNALLYMAGGR